MKDSEAGVFGEKKYQARTNFVGIMGKVRSTFRQMKLSFSHNHARSFTRIINRNAPCLVTLLLLCSLTTTVAAQHGFQRTYQTRPNVRLELENFSGSVRVEVWQKSGIEVRAEMEKKARIDPVLSENALTINVLRDNGGMRDMGDINFVIHVPVNSSVDLKTKMGNLRVNGVQGQYVRADVALEGDIELVGISVNAVWAQNSMGNIFFGGELHRNGDYFFSSRQGDINIRIPDSSGFSLTASAPVTRRIELGPFARFFEGNNDPRRTQGVVGGGGSKLTVTNTRGIIIFR